jgi:hypothetical protein
MMRQHGRRSTRHENPMALGAAALAIGAMVGFSLPRTQRRDASMGDTREDFHSVCCSPRMTYLCH